MGNGLFTIPLSRATAEKWESGLSDGQSVIVCPKPLQEQANDCTVDIVTPSADRLKFAENVLTDLNRRFSTNIPGPLKNFKADLDRIKASATPPPVPKPASTEGLIFLTDATAAHLEKFDDSSAQTGLLQKTPLYSEDNLKNRTYYYQFVPPKRGWQYSEASWRTTVNFAINVMEAIDRRKQSGANVPKDVEQLYADLKKHSDIAFDPKQSPSPTAAISVEFIQLVSKNEKLSDTDARFLSKILPYASDLPYVKKNRAAIETVLDDRLNTGPRLVQRGTGVPAKDSIDRPHLPSNGEPKLADLKKGTVDLFAEEDNYGQTISKAFIKGRLDSLFQGLIRKHSNGREGFMYIINFELVLKIDAGGKLTHVAVQQLKVETDFEQPMTIEKAVIENSVSSIKGLPPPPTTAAGQSIIIPFSFDYTS